MTTRDNAIVTVKDAVDGSKRVSTRKKSPTPARIHNKKIHPDVLAFAMRHVNGDISRLDPLSETLILIKPQSESRRP